MWHVCSVLLEEINYRLKSQGARTAWGSSAWGTSSAWGRTSSFPLSQQSPNWRLLCTGKCFPSSVQVASLRGWLCWDWLWRRQPDHTPRSCAASFLRNGWHSSEKQAYCCPSYIFSLEKEHFETFDNCKPFLFVEKELGDISEKRTLDLENIESSIEDLKDLQALVASQPDNISGK